MFKLKLWFDKFVCELYRPVLTWILLKILKILKNTRHSLKI